MIFLEMKSQYQKFILILSSILLYFSNDHQNQRIKIMDPKMYCEKLEFLEYY